MTANQPPVNIGQLMAKLAVSATNIVKHQAAMKQVAAAAVKRQREKDTEGGEHA